MIFITSDTHGDIERFNDKALKPLKIGDTLIILGDFGFIWANDKKDTKILKKLARLPYKILFIDGKNENLPVIMEYPQVTYMSANANEIYKGKIYYIHRGEILDIEGKKILCFGGFDNYDIDFQLEQLIPTTQEFEHCVKNLSKYNNKVDYILTHIPSGKINRFINLDSHHTSNLMGFYDAITDNVEYTKWFFGSQHVDKFISPKVQAVYTGVVKI